MRRALHRWEALLLLPLALAHALVARLARPAAPCPPQVLQACSVASRGSAVAPPVLATLRVVELRALARARGLRGMGSARRSALLEVLAR